MTDSSPGTAFTQAEAFVMQIVSALPIAVADTATVFDGASVTIPVTDNDESFAPITAIEITRRPIPGSATASGLNIEYRSVRGVVVNTSLEYVIVSAAGRSA